MRTVILISGVIISDAIRNQPSMSDFYGSEVPFIISMILGFCAMADVFDFFKK